MDTNLWVSGLIWGGTPARIIELAEQGKIKIICCPEILEEINRVLGYERLRKIYRRARRTKEELLGKVLEIADFVADPSGNERWIPEDEDDDKFVRLAITENIHILLSGDGHLLGVKEIQGVKILSATEFLKELM
jgi:putative PIN family toxin of toxin-antitoxin system